jgi:hypothetical protein
MEDISTEETQVKTPNAPTVFTRGLEGFHEFAETLDDCDDALQNLSLLADKTTQRKVAKLTAQLKALQPSVTFIGQIKAGKTALVNAVLGQPGFLPTDVNPWTSVVTSLHVNTPNREDDTRAEFQFFDEEEWDRLVQNGGRIGELASRAGADEELDKVRDQIAEMREKTRERLGRKFELLLGQEHSYSHLDDELIQRYVCMGDEDDEDMPDDQGRFADITKSAAMYVDRPEFPMPITLRDTPGVNDTFMMREQITINAIRDSRICAVVLSAHQALSSMDMGLIRLISNVKAREILIFVNRIDELSDPATQVPEIHASIVETLRTNNGPEDAEIVFGSAYWANTALEGSLDAMDEDSAKAFDNWAAGTLAEESKTLDKPALLWEASGVPAFYRALAERVAEGPGKDALQKAAQKAINLAHGLEVSNQVTINQMDGAPVKAVDPAQLTASLDRIEMDSIAQLTTETDAVMADYTMRIDQSHDRFLERATSSLIEHLEQNGEEAVWQYSPMGLRLLLRSSYQVLSKKINNLGSGVYTDAATKIAQLYTEVYDVSVDGFAIEPPVAPHIPPPVSVGQTIALDLQTSWWKGWWKRRRGYKAFAEDFYKLIHQETAPIVDDLKFTQAEMIRDNTLTVLKEFLADQRAILTGVVERAEMSGDDLNELFGIISGRERQECLELTVDELSEYAA